LPAGKIPGPAFGLSDRFIQFKVTAYMHVYFFVTDSVQNTVIGGQSFCNESFDLIDQTVFYHRIKTFIDLTI
jgi:hypothetical protein